MKEGMETPSAEHSSKSQSEIMGMTETKILIVGLVLAILYCQFLVVMLFINVDYATGLATMSGAHFFGRAAGLSHGYYVLNYPSWVVISVNALLETMAVLIAYPTFVLVMEKMVVWKSLQDKILHIRNSAEKNKGWVRRFGLLGLFLFVLFPFWMTGPIVGCIIGYILHMRIWVNLSVVLGGTYVAIFAWATIFRSIQKEVQAYGVWAPAGIVGMVVALSLAMHLYHRKVKSSQNSVPDDSSGSSSSDSDAGSNADTGE
jgi:uncharacterized membrane protein